MLVSLDRTGEPNELIIPHNLDKAVLSVPLRAFSKGLVSARRTLLYGASEARTRPQHLPPVRTRANHSPRRDLSHPLAQAPVVHRLLRYPVHYSFHKAAASTTTSHPLTCSTTSEHKTVARPLRVELKITPQPARPVRTPHRVPAVASPAAVIASAAARSWLSFLRLRSYHRA